LSRRACRRLCPTGKVTGLLYLSGKGVARDFAEARRLFEQGAALGNAACMNGLGAIYNEGDGVRRDVKVARQWFENCGAGQSRGEAEFAGNAQVTVARRI
jgi:TPR repeat protein